MIDFSCLIVKADGKPKWVDQESFRREWAQVGEGQELECTFSEPALFAKRTRAQEKFFHGPVIRCFMDRCGYTKNEAKAMLCLMFIPQEVRTMDGQLVTVPGSTSALSKKEYSELIESCIQLAAENDWYIEDADEWRKKHGAAA